MLVAIVWTPKDISLHDSAQFEQLCVKIHPGVTSVGEFKK